MVGSAQKEAWSGLWATRKVTGSTVRPSRPWASIPSWSLFSESNLSQKDNSNSPSSSYAPFQNRFPFWYNSNRHSVSLTAREVNGKKVEEGGRKEWVEDEEEAESAVLGSMTAP